jgi:hypothetical protein
MLTHTVQKALDCRISKLCFGRRNSGRSPLRLAKCACKTWRRLQNGVAEQLSPVLFCLGNSLTIVLSLSKTCLSFSPHYHGYAVPNSLRSQVDDMASKRKYGSKGVVSLEQWLGTRNSVSGDQHPSSLMRYQGMSTEYRRCYRVLFLCSIVL